MGRGILILVISPNKLKSGPLPLRVPQESCDRGWGRRNPATVTVQPFGLGGLRLPYLVGEQPRNACQAKQLIVSRRPHSGHDLAVLRLWDQVTRA